MKALTCGCAVGAFAPSGIRMGHVGAWAPKRSQNSPPGAPVGWADTGVVNRTGWVAAGREAAPGWHQVGMNTTPSPQPTLLLNLNEVATQLRWTRRTVEKQIAQRRLRAVHLGRSVRVERTELDRFIASMRDADGG